MSIKKLSLLFPALSITAFPFIVFSSCSSTTYQVIIPKILNPEIKKIQEEIAASSVEAWVTEKKLLPIDQLILTSSNPAGYISGGNAIAKNFKDIKISNNATQIIFIMTVDTSSLFRFINSKNEMELEKTIFVDIIAPPVK